MTTILPARSLHIPHVATSPVATAQVLENRPNHYFSPDVEAELTQSDHQAWTAVCSILITIVSLGLVLGIGGVLLTL